MNTTELLNEVVSLPLEERARITEALLESMNSPEDSTTQAWLQLARRRMEETDQGKVSEVPGEQVFERIRQKFAR